MKRPLRSAWKMAGVAAALFHGLNPTPALAARFPNAVEKRIVISGDAARRVAALFGLSSSKASATLQLGRTDAWAVYLLKQDTKTPLTNGEGPRRYNHVSFSASPIAILTIEPFWLDLATQLPDSKPGYFSFDSPFLSENSKSGDAWNQLLLRLKAEPGWNVTGRPEFQRCFTSSDKSEICIAVYATKDYTNNIPRDGYQEIITVKLAPPQ